jgi:tetratricopeptide (TPR) repeat protein
MRKYLKPFFIIAACCVSTAIFSQKTEIYTTENRFFQEAMDLFVKEKYAASHDRFHLYISTQNDPHEELRIAAEYYSAICSLYLFHKDAEYMLEKFVLEHPDTPWVAKVYYELATYNYKRKKYKKAVEWFEYVDPRDLTNQQLTEFYFKRGHCYFQEDDYESAKQDLREVKDLDTEYKTPATYYYSHIAYSEGNNQTALDGFTQLAQDENFAPVVPYYITQIYYKQGRYEKVLEYAPPLLDTAVRKTTKRIPEISQIVGDAYYRESKYEEAIPYLEAYHEKVPKKDRTPNDFYQLGYAYYNTGDYLGALDGFNYCTDGDDELSQSAFYYMGDCYMKLDQKPYARTAFSEASEMDHNMTLKEDALFNYAKLAFELSYNPFHEAIDAFEKYLEEYPNSARSDEAYEFLLNVYMKSKNYEAALRSLERIDNKDTRTMEAYQVVAYNRAVELYKAKHYEEAQEYFDKVSKYDVNATLNAEAIFWKAENAFQLKHYEDAYILYQRFLNTSGSINSGFYEEANYGAGYAQFKQKEFTAAAAQFKKFVDYYKGDDPMRLADARVRLGDCYYVQKKYDLAVAQYDKAILADQISVDHAMLQKAICLGWQDKHDKKIAALHQLLQDQPNSRYTADAKFALAQTYLYVSDLGKARTWYQDVLDNHGNSHFRKKSLADMILIAVKQGNKEEAVDLWNIVLAEYKNDPIRQTAYRIVEDILYEMGESPPPDIVTPTEHEENVFRHAADYAFTGDCATGITKLQDYLNKFEPALFGVEANYHLGNCHFELGQKDKALNAYNFVVAQPLSDYTEPSLIVAATINYNNKNYAQAKNHYGELEHVATSKNNVLEAEIGLMRCHYWLGATDYALQYAEKVILNDNTPTDIKNTAYLWRGRIRLDQGQNDDAYYDFVEVEKGGGANGAEAKFRMAEIAFQKGAFKPCEKEIFDLIQNYAAYSEWKYKGFLMLVDVYVGLDDLFQAKATLNTIMDNVSEPWVIDAANAKMAELEALEDDESGAPAPRSEEIDLGGDGDGERLEDLDEQ